MTKISHPENVAQTQIDTGNAKTKPTKLGWTSAETEKITRTLNALLANYTVHYQKLRNYHWNVKGSDFFDLHIEFENQYTQALKNIDDIAERIRIFGETPMSALREYLETSEIKETTSNLSSELMVREVLSDYRILIQYMYSVVEVAAEEKDSGTEEMVKVFINQLEKRHWMLSAFLAN
ncbi:MAG: DNA starvation/stationary phase protection protein [Bacteroidota bacterium]